MSDTCYARQRLELRLFRLAERYEGWIPLPDLAGEIGLDCREAQAFMESLVDGNRVRLERSAWGGIVHECPEVRKRVWSNAPPTAREDGPTLGSPEPGLEKPG